MSDDEKIVCFGALKTFYKDIEEIFVKKDSEDASEPITNEEIDEIMRGERAWQEEY